MVKQDKNMKGTSWQEILFSSYPKGMYDCTLAFVSCSSFFPAFFFKYQFEASINLFKITSQIFGVPEDLIAKTYHFLQTITQYILM